MKNLFNLLMLLLFLVNPVTSQNNSGRGFNYQAVARDANGNIRQNEPIELRFSMLNGGSNGDVEYSETHYINTDAYGTFSIVVGQGVSAEGTEYSSLDFRINSYWLKVEIADEGEFKEMSNQQLLSVPYAENISFIPVGTILPFAGSYTTEKKELLNRQGWMPCDGTILSAKDYPELFYWILEYWGEADDGIYDYVNGESGDKFRLPDLRGVFLRGVDNGAGRDPDQSSRTSLYPGESSGRGVGSYQDDALQSHTHTMGKGGSDSNQSTQGGGSQRFAHFINDIWNAGSKKSTDASVGNETRPVNVYVNYIIKVK